LSKIVEMGKVKDYLWNEPEHDNDFPHNDSNEPKQENDMKLNEMIPSTGKYLKKEDVDPAILVTIANFSQDDVSAQNEPPDIKAILHFNNIDKPLVLNQTNGQLLAIATGLSMEADTAEYVGREIVLFNDKTVSFGGKITGGIRIRARRMQPENAQPAPATQYGAAAEPSNPVAQHSPAAEPFNDDIPF